MLLLGITGTDGSGKGTAVEYLVAHKGFVHYSARQIWIEILTERGEEVNRPNMRLVANEMRAKHGNDFLITYYYEKIQKEQPERVIIESIRALDEATALKRVGGTLLAIDADQKLRYERVQGRRSESDKVTFEQFVAQEEMELNDPDPHGMQKRKVMELADYTIQNDTTLSVFTADIETFCATVLHI